MGLLKSNEEKLREKEEQRETNKKLWLAPYIEKGFNISKSIYIPDYNSKKSEINDGCVVVDIENKKWAYTSKNLFNKGIVKIYDFNEFVKYDAQRNDNNIALNTSSGVIVGNMYTNIKTDDIKRINYKFVAFTNSKSIDDTSIVLLNQDGYSLTIPEYDNVMEELQKTFEYILNNKGSISKSIDTKTSNDNNYSCPTNNTIIENSVKEEKIVEDNICNSSNTNSELKKIMNISIIAVPVILEVINYIIGNIMVRMGIRAIIIAGIGISPSFIISGIITIFAYNKFLSKYL